MMDFKFGTAINCIDGRTQEPVIDFMKQKYNIDGVDMVTFPGVDGVISNGENSDEIAFIRSLYINRETPFAHNSSCRTFRLRG